MCTTNQIARNGRTARANSLRIMLPTIHPVYGQWWSDMNFRELLLAVVELVGGQIYRPPIR